MTEFILTLFVILLISIGPVVLIYVWGGKRRNKFLRNLEMREAKVQHIQVYNVKRLPNEYLHAETVFIGSSVVMGIDSARTWISSIKQFFGGDISIFADFTVLTRRAALVGLKEEALRNNADAIFNLRYDGVNLNNSSVQVGNQAAPCRIAMYCYGTALKR